MIYYITKYVYVHVACDVIDKWKNPLLKLKHFEGKNANNKKSFKVIFLLTFVIFILSSHVGVWTQAITKRKECRDGKSYTFKF